MLTEYIGTGLTIAALVDTVDGLAEDEYAGFETQIDVLENSFKRELHSVHRLDVVHADLAGRNMLVLEDQVVIVDFGCAKVGYQELAVFNAGKEMDFLRLESVFAGM